MKRILFLIISFISCVFLFSQEAREVVSRADEKMRGNTSQIEMTIRTVRPAWSREMDIKAWMKGTDYAMIVIQSPAKDKGIVFSKTQKRSVELDAFTGKNNQAATLYDEPVVDGHRFYK